MLKVLYLINHAGQAGTETYVRLLVERLNNKHIKAYFAYNEEGLAVQWMKDLGLEPIKIEMKNRLDIKAAWKLAQICRKLDIDVIHAQYQRENYIALMSKFFNPKVKVIYTSHFVIREGMPWRLINRFLLSLESYVIAVCTPGKEMLASNGYPRNRINVIFNGIEPLREEDKKPSTLREELGIGDDEFVMLCLSRFAHDKGHEFLINAIGELKNLTDRKFKCVLGGVGPLLEDRKKQVRDMKLEDDIIFIGYRNDKYNLYNGSDIYVNSSEHEALSFAIIEALSAGLPVIATDMGGNSDIINDKTQCGILVEYNDVKGLANAIKKVMDDSALRERLHQNALKAVNEIFNLDKMSMETYNLYIRSCQRTKK